MRKLVITGVDRIPYVTPLGVRQRLFLVNAYGLPKAACSCLPTTGNGRRRLKGEAYEVAASLVRRGLIQAVSHPRTSKWTAYALTDEGKKAIGAPVHDL